MGGYLSEDDAQRIDNLQSTTILKNSLLLGYTITNPNKDNLRDENYQTLESIGDNFSTFQKINDIENFFDTGRNPNSDLNYRRKNVVLSKVPAEIFETYSDDEILRYAKDNKLLEDAMDEVRSENIATKELFKQLSSSVGRSTLQLAFGVIDFKTQKKFKNWRNS